MSNDYISRQDAIDAMDTWDKFGCDPDGKLVWYDDDKHYVPYVHYDDMVYAIKSLPSAQPEPKWIPCSERMPSEDGWYFITRNDRTTSVAFFNAHCKSSDRKWVGIRTPLAWLSLPEPYKGDEP